MANFSRFLGLVLVAGAAAQSEVGGLTPCDGDCPASTTPVNIYWMYYPTSCGNLLGRSLKQFYGKDAYKASGANFVGPCLPDTPLADVGIAVGAERVRAALADIPFDLYGADAMKRTLESTLSVAPAGSKVTILPYVYEVPKDANDLQSTLTPKDAQMDYFCGARDVCGEDCCEVKAGLMDYFGKDGIELGVAEGTTIDFAGFRYYGEEGASPLDNVGADDRIVGDIEAFLNFVGSNSAEYASDDGEVNILVSAVSDIVKNAMANSRGDEGVFDDLKAAYEANGLEYPGKVGKPTVEHGMVFRDQLLLDADNTMYRDQQVPIEVAYFFNDDVHQSYEISGDMSELYPSAVQRCASGSLTDTCGAECLNSTLTGAVRDFLSSDLSAALKELAAAEKELERLRNAPCGTNLDCPGNKYCSPNRGRCMRKKEAGEYCNKVQQCGEGLECMDRRCA